MDDPKPDAAGDGERKSSPQNEGNGKQLGQTGTVGHPVEIVEKPQRRKRKPKKQKRDWYDKWLVGISALTFVAAAAAAIFTGLIWESADQTAKRQLRAYLSVELAEPVGPEPFNQIRLRLVNSGQTPAYRIAYGVRLFPAVPDYVETMDGGSWSFGPRAREREIVGVLTKTANRVFFTDDKNFIDPKILVEGQRHLIAIGNIYYDDIYGDPHWMTFCLHWPGNGLTQDKTTYCNRYNESDETLPNVSKYGPLHWTAFPYRTRKPDPKN